MNIGTFKPTKQRDVDSPKGALAELYDQHGGVKRVMVRLGIGQSQAYAYTDPQSPEEISFAKLCALTTPLATAGAELLCRLAGGVFVPVLTAEDVSTLSITAVAEQSKEQGEAVAAVLHAIADSIVTPQERNTTLTEIDEAIRGLVKLRAGIVAAAEGQG